MRSLYYCFPGMNTEANALNCKRNRQHTGPGTACLLVLLLFAFACQNTRNPNGELPQKEAGLLRKAEACVNSHPDSSLIYVDSLLKTAKITGDSLRNSIHLLRARAFYEEGKIDSALRILPGLKDQCRTDKDTLNWLRAENLTGMILMHLGQAARAIGHAQTAFDLAEQSKQTMHQVKALVNLANFCSENNELVKSQSYLYRALRLTKDSDSLALMSEIASSMSHNFLLMGMMDSARNYGYKAVSISEQLKIPVRRFNSYNNMGMLHKRLNEDSALFWLRKALELNPKSLEARFNVINIYAGLGKWSLASGMLDTLLTDCRDAGSGPGITRCLYQKAKILNGQGKSEDAIPYLNEAIQISDSLGLGYINKIARESLAEIFRSSGRTGEALALTNMIRRTGDSINKREKLIALQMMQNYEEAEQLRAKLRKEQSQSTQERTNKNKIVGLLSSLIVALVLFIIFFRYFSKRKRMALMQQLDRYREEVARWEQQKNVTVEEATLLERLIRHLEQEKPWLNPDLKSDELIEQLNCSRSALYAELTKANIPGLSQLVQQYRVKEAIRLMEDPNYLLIKLEAIGAESGFGSYRSFHRSFEQITGFTPARYRRNMEEQSLITP